MRAARYQLGGIQIAMVINVPQLSGVPTRGILFPKIYNGVHIRTIQIQMAQTVMIRERGRYVANTIEKMIAIEIKVGAQAQGAVLAGHPTMTNPGGVALLLKALRRRLIMGNVTAMGIVVLLHKRGWPRVTIICHSLHNSSVAL
jgi:hypothetical protein